MIDRIRACMATSLKLDPATAARIIESSTAADVPGWTSVAHLSLILDLERTFSVHFGNDEIASLGSVRAILAALTRKGVR